MTMEALQEEVDELRYQIESANPLVAEYKATRDRTKKHEEENCRNTKTQENTK